MKDNTQLWLVLGTWALVIVTVIFNLHTALMTRNSQEAVNKQLNLAQEQLEVYQQQANSSKKQLELYSPNVNVEITDGKSPLSQINNPNYVHHVSRYSLNDTEYDVPIKININNMGLMPIQALWVEFETKCGKGNSGYIQIPESSSDPLQPGRDFSVRDKISINLGSVNQTLGSAIPCEINFIVRGSNWIMNKKMSLKTYSLT